MGSEEPLLRVRDLKVSVRRGRRQVEVVRSVSFDLWRGETLALVGETGSGKTMSVMALLRLVGSGGVSVTGEAIYGGTNLVRCPEPELRSVRGRRIGVIFQDPMSALNPVVRLGDQIAEAILIHDRSKGRRAALARAVELLDEVGLPDAPHQARRYPHELSGGMRQRVMIAMAVANAPEVLIADEPTTALDVTTQAQIMEVFRRVRYESGGGAILITHDLALVGEVADRVAVMYAGCVVESGPVDEVLDHPRHPYTRGLLRCVPSRDGRGELLPLPGEVPEPGSYPPGCSFFPRCELARGRERCEVEWPRLLPAGSGLHASACHFHEELAEPLEASGALEGQS